MDYASFKQIKDRPHGVTSSSLRSGTPLDFRGDAASKIAMLDDFSSFEDLTSDLGIEVWAEDFQRVFPSFEAIATADFEHVEEPDSYSEFVVLVDTAQPKHPVYFFSAESWDWDDWESKPGKGFSLVSPSFAEFHASLGSGDHDDE